ncbi:MAG: purine-nucleoside phosphorylase [Anaerolineae bacterium]|nr:purine-nucleoside phosphorylase [Anaerolineae bacterium]
MTSPTGPEFTLADYDNTAAFIRQQTRHSPRYALILGSGLGPLAESIADADIIPYATIPNWPPSTVVGHSGRLVIGMLEGQSVLVMQGRAHFYEGHSMAAVTFPIRVMKRLGIETLIVTNAAGGIDPSFQAGDLMLIQDHISFPGMAGHHPLRGPNDDNFGTRFPDLSNAYNRALRQLTRTVAQEQGIALHEGVYASVSGPSFETPAEIRALRTLGANAVGMSTAPEVIIANHAGMRVLGISGISNRCIDDPDSESITNHEEVLEAGKTLVPKLTALLRGVLARLGTGA